MLRTRPRLHWLLAIATGQAIAACSDSSGDVNSCRSDNECKGERICEDGSCVEPQVSTTTDTAGSETNVMNCEDGCSIDGLCYIQNELRDPGSCDVCAPNVNYDKWTTVQKDNPCPGNATRLCEADGRCGARQNFCGNTGVVCPATETAPSYCKDGSCASCGFTFYRTQVDGGCPGTVVEAICPQMPAGRLFVFAKGQAEYDGDFAVVVRASDEAGSEVIRFDESNADTSAGLFTIVTQSALLFSGGPLRVTLEILDCDGSTHAGNFEGVDLTVSSQPD